MFLKVNTIYDSNDANEYQFRLELGGVFVTFNDGKNVVGIYFDRISLNEVNLEKAKKHAISFFPDLKKCELKLIGEIHSINKCSKFLPDNLFSFVKRVVRDTDVDVIYNPNIGRVRISIENVVELKKGKIKILIVDDSKTIRTILNKMFSTDPSFEVIGMLENPTQVESFIEKNRPDVITLDIHMPEMDGVTLLKQIYPKFKIPCVMISSISLQEGPMVFDALESGAVDYIQKPEAKDIEALTPVFIEKIKMASNVRSQDKSKHILTKVKAQSDINALVVIGSSTGGTEALRHILTALPDQIPPILIVQHIPAVFSLAFAKRMNELCSFEVKEAENGDEVMPNRVLIAPGGFQMKMIHRNNKTYVEINSDEPVNRFRPSVDYLFSTVVQNLFCHTVAVILTGMGRDGAREMLNLKKKGAVTIAQNEESCIVFGMPREAILIGAADYVEHLSNIAERITYCTNKSNFKKVGNS